MGIEFTLAELCIASASEAFEEDGESLATGIGIIPRLAASLAMKTCNRDLMMTDSESFMLSEPNPIGSRDANFIQANESWMGFSRIFDNVWSGRRHAMVGPSQIDRFGQTNISALGEDYRQPKVMMLGSRGFPGNSISHRNSFFCSAHTKRVFVSGECDFVSSVGYNPSRLPRGHSLEEIDIHRIVTNLCVMDFGGPDYQPRLRSLHPGVSLETVIENTGFQLFVPDPLPETIVPTDLQLDIIASLDPHNLRASQIKDDLRGSAN